MEKPNSGTQHKLAISMMVDALPEHYYKTELLLFSLTQFGKVPNDSIIVQCVDRVSEQFRQFVQQKGYLYRSVQPYLDGAYCNKLQQLVEINHFIQPTTGILLLDVDMIVVDTIELPVYDKILGKIVDAPNPPISVLEKIFTTAGIDLPKKVPCDWQTGDTFETNFNGGFIYVPSVFIADVSASWRYWAAWLFARPELFESPQQRIHIDQISLAMALSNGKYPYENIPANFNFPGHTQQIPYSFQQNDPLKVLHYHWEISDFGLIQNKLGDFQPTKEAVNRFNEALTKQKSIQFFSHFKRDKANVTAKVEKLDNQKLSTALKQVTENLPQRRLIIHAGTPKTGTTSLQNFLNTNRESLVLHGIWYPHSDGKTKAPKHQWLMQSILEGDENKLSEHVIATCNHPDPNIHTIILSTEGIYNHWWDFNSKGKSMLATFLEFFNVEIWIWFRNPEDFVSSFYRQNLSNPRCMPSYGMDLSVTAAMAIPWFAKHLDYLGFIYEIQALLGRNAIRAFPYIGDTISTCKAALKIENLPDYSTLENPGFDQVGVDMLRIVNRYNLPFDVKESIAQQIKEINRTVNKYDNNPFLLEEKDLSAIKQMTALTKRVLYEEMGLAF